MRLAVNRVYKSFGEKQVLQDVSFVVDSGKALGLLGRNGAGKTTLIRIITNIFAADRGEVTLDGKALRKTEVKLGYLPEERGLYPKVTVSDQMLYFAELQGIHSSKAKKRALALLEELEAGEYFKKKLDTLSKGNQQKIQLAIALLNDPDVVILDEPFSGLDPVNAQLLKNMVNSQAKQNKIVLFSSHQMPYVEEFCEHICIINQGVVALDGIIKEIKKGYNRNTVEVTPTDGYDSILKQLKPFEDRLTELSIKDGNVVFTVKKEQDKRLIMKELTTEGVDGFWVVEPTLEQIFVEVTGDR